jgi:hypothetical protein
MMMMMDIDIVCVLAALFSCSDRLHSCVGRQQRGSMMMMMMMMIQ